MAWQRPRSSRGGGHFFTSKRQAHFQGFIKKAWGIVYPDAKPWEGPVVMTIKFIMPRPQAQEWKTKPTPPYPHIKIPDLDNLIKGVIDALQGLAFVDDKQVVEICAGKVVAPGGSRPGVIIAMGGE